MVGKKDQECVVKVQDKIKDQIRKELLEILSLYVSVGAEFHGYKMLRRLVLKRVFSKISFKNFCRLKNFLIYERAFDEVFQDMVKYHVISIKRQKKYFLISLKIITLDLSGESYG